LLDLRGAQLLREANGQGAGIGNTSAVIRIFLLNDHAALRTGLRLMLNTWANLRVVGKKPRCSNSLPKAHLVKKWPIACLPAGARRKRRQNLFAKTQA